MSVANAPTTPSIYVGVLSDTMSRLFTVPTPLLLDGGMGTALIDRGLIVNAEPADLWNITQPEIIRRVHAEFIDAGASAIQTNTFGANRLRLHSSGHAAATEDLNLEGARIARDAAPSGVLVIGSMGPTGAVPPPEGSANLAEMEYAFAEQAAALQEGGVDLLHVETLYHPKEARAAIRGCRAGARNIPVVASVSCSIVTNNYRTTMGFAAETILSTLLEEKVDGLGVNCALLPAEMLDLIRLLRDRTDLPIFAQPTAKPEPRRAIEPDEFATGAVALLAVGADAVGGCCGTKPAHIEAAHDAIIDGITTPNEFQTQPWGS